MVQTVCSRAGLLLGVASLLVAVVLSARGRSSGLWTVAFLVTPVALCFVEPTARRIRGERLWNPAGYDDLVTATLGLTLCAVVFAFAVGLLARRSRT